MDSYERVSRDTQSPLTPLNPADEKPKFDFSMPIPEPAFNSNTGQPSRKRRILMSVENTEQINEAPMPKIETDVPKIVVTKPQNFDADMKIKTEIEVKQEVGTEQRLIPFVNLGKRVDCKKEIKEEEETSTTLSASEEQGSSEEKFEDFELVDVGKICDDAASESSITSSISSSDHETHPYDTRYKSENSYFHPQPHHKKKFHIKFDSKMKKLNKNRLRVKQEKRDQAEPCDIIARLFTTDELLKYVPIFAREEIDYSVLITMDTDDFRLLGLDDDDMELIDSTLQLYRQS